MIERRGRFFPEQGNRQPPRGMEVRGGTRFHAIVTRPPDRGRSPAPTLPREAPPPSAQDQVIREVLEEALGTPDKPKKNRKSRVLIGSSVIGAGLAIAGAWGVKHYVFEDNTSSANSQTQSAGSFPNSFTDNRLVPKESINKDEIFDNAATRGVKSERNTIPISREEYQKIAPPVIDRENRKEVPGEFALPPDTAKATGNKTRKLTLERGTSINAMIYVKTPEGKIRETTYIKVANPGKVTGVYPAPVLFPGCAEYLGLEREIQAGDIFPAPISGRVYYYGKKLEDGSIGSLGEDQVHASYIIEGEYYDESGKRFTIVVPIGTFGITKPLIENIPNRFDESFKEKVIGIDSSGKEIETSLINKGKIPIVTVQQGEDLFKFITKPPAKHFDPASSIKSQVATGGSYRDIRDVDLDARGEGYSDIFGGENCLHPTVDNKAVVLIQ